MSIVAYIETVENICNFLFLSLKKKVQTRNNDMSDQKDELDHKEEPHSAQALLLASLRSRQPGQRGLSREMSNVSDNVNGESFRFFCFWMFWGFYFIDRQNVQRLSFI